MRWMAAILFWVAAALFAVTARAEEPPGQYRLVWIRGEHAEACATGFDLAKRVSERLGSSVFSEAAPQSIEGVVQHRESSPGNRWAARMYVRSADGRLVGTRDLTSDAEDCEALNAAVTLAIALVIDPEAALRPAAPPPSARTRDAAQADAQPPKTPPPAERPAKPVCPLAEPCPSPPASPSREIDRTETSFVPRIVGATGVLPAAALGVALDADIRIHGRAQATAGLLYLPEVRTTSGEFAFGVTAPWLGVCGQLLGDAPVQLPVCASFYMGAIHSVVYTLAPTRPGDRIWSAVSASARIRVRVAGPVVAEAGGEVLAPLTRQRFNVDGRSDVAFQEAPVGVVGSLGIGMTIR